MKFSRSTLFVLLSLALCASSINTEEDNRIETSSSSRGVRRRLIDFFDEAQQAEEEEQLEDLQRNGDPDQVEIVDSAGDEEKEDEEVQEDTQMAEEQEQEQTPAEPPQGIANRRRFVKYEPSEWETQWVDQIDDIMQSKSLCRSLLGSDAQKEKMHKYLEAICINRSEEPGMWQWCYYEDVAHYVWYNSENRDRFELYVNEMPEGLTERPVYKANVLDADKAEGILSKFTFFDEFNNEEYTEYIEPLISHLRFPLAGCMLHPSNLAELTITVLNPGYLDRTNLIKIFYDMGSSDWGRLQYIIRQWALYDAIFSEVISFSPFLIGEKDKDPFPGTVPEQEKGRIFREYLELVDAPTEDPAKIFIPDVIAKQVVVNDYTLLKLDSGNAVFKETLVQFILNHADNLPIDELIWTQNNPDNYSLLKYMENHASVDDMSSTTLGDTYRTLQALRNKGIRAHAWI